MDKQRLSSDEDIELRLLHVLASFGNVADTVAARYRELRMRDRRDSVRDLHEASVANPGAVK